MKRKIISMFCTVLFVIFSFYYTEKATEVVEKKDPVMKKIEKEKEKMELSSVNAIVDGAYLIPGYAGLKVNAKKSFQKMKQYGAYKESLLVFEEVEPTLSKEEYYDKYIVSGNGFNSNVALVFKIKEDTDITTLKDMLEKENIIATFFVDGAYLEKNRDTVTSLARDFHEIELLSYQDAYDPLLFEASLSELQIITNVEGKYCYAEYDQKEVLELCEKNKMHTIIPTIKISNHPYNTVKGKLKNGSIISMEVTKENLEELPVVARYIRQRGYTLESLDQLLNEARGMEK